MEQKLLSVQSTPRKQAGSRGAGVWLPGVWAAPERVGPFGTAPRSRAGGANSLTWLFSGTCAECHFWLE